MISEINSITTLVCKVKVEFNCGSDIPQYGRIKSIGN